MQSINKIQNNSQTKPKIITKKYFNTSPTTQSPKSKKNIYLDKGGGHKTCVIGITFINNKITGKIELFLVYNVMTKNVYPLPKNKFFTGPNHDLPLIKIEGKNYGENNKYETSKTSCIYGIKIGEELPIETCKNIYSK
jgi:hypothetical protein